MKHMHLKYKSKQIRSSIQKMYIPEPEPINPNPDKFEIHRQSVKLLDRAQYLEKQMILKQQNKQINKVLATLESYNKIEKKICLLDRHLKRAMDIDDNKY